jgi:hypothetical protein
MTLTQLHTSIAARTGEPLSVIRRLGFRLLTLRRTDPGLEHLRLVLHCPFCGQQVPYPGRARDGSNALAECTDCDVYFDFKDSEVFPTHFRADHATVPTRARFQPG